MSDYNGWTNYETWSVKLWLDNEEPTYVMVTESARGAVEKGASVYAFADWLRDYVTDMQPDLPASMASDLLSAALSNVNWTEIAQAYLDDVEEAA